MDKIIDDLSNDKNLNNTLNLLLYILEDALIDNKLSKFENYNSEVLSHLVNLVCKDKHPDNLLNELTIIEILLANHNGEVYILDELLRSIHLKAKNRNDIKIFECNILYIISKKYQHSILDNYIYILETIQEYFLDDSSKMLNLSSARVLLKILQNKELTNCRLILRDIQLRIRKYYIFLIV